MEGGGSHMLSALARLPPQVTHRSDVSLISIITNACRTAHIAAVIGDACSALSRESISVEMASIGASTG